jgi:hypothetical protein
MPAMNPQGDHFDPEKILPPALRGFLTITEIDEARFVVGNLFRRKFNDTPPDVPHHLVCLYRDTHDALHLAGYSHMRPFGEVLLSGGSCTNGETLRRMQAHEREAVQASEGIWFYLLKYAFAKYANQCEAFFGHCGNPRALEVALAAGFVQTDHAPVIVHWHKLLPATRQRELTAKVVALGEF